MVIFNLSTFGYDCITINVYRNKFMCYIYDNDQIILILLK